MTVIALSPRPPRLAVSLAFLLAGISLVLLSGCTTAYTATAASLTAAERIVQAAAEQYPEFDKLQRKEIVMHAPSAAEGKRLLEQWDAVSDKCVRAIEGAHASVKLGADGLRGVRDGLVDPKSLQSWIGPAIRVGTDLLGLLKAVGLDLRLAVK